MNGEGKGRPSTRTGAQLYDLLPEVYRTRDRDPAQGGGDLAPYLDACGELLDRVRNTLDQRLADAFPDRPEHGRAAQGWILPYLAQLLDARLVSTHEEGRRREVARAVAWRQRKGTLATVDEIAEAVGQTRAEVHEGWKRVAVTPRLGVPLEPAANLPRPLDRRNPLDAALHPGLPATTPDLRRQVCLPGTHEDRTRRTADGRLPSWKHGHHHPRRLVLFVPPPVGFYPVDHPDPLTFEVGPDEPVVLRGVAARKVVVRANGEGGGGVPLLDARDCLFGEVEAEEALVRLEYCTVLGDLSARRLLASDCLFAGGVEIADRTVEAASCLRYSRIPPELVRQARLSEEGSPSVTWLRRPATTTEEPAFFDLDFCHPEGVPESPAFGRPGCGALHPATPDAICFGAEDGGEMGAYHRDRHCLRRAAVLEKLRDFLPVGIEAALVPDPRLLEERTETTTPSP